MLSVGDKAPSFKLKNQNDENISLSNFKGSKLLIWFFPKASTGGCTKEGCGIRDNFKKFQKNNINVVGVSKDSVKAQSNFSTKNNFPYDLLSDTELNMIKAYRAWGKKKMYGKEYEGIVRISYLINEKGVIEQVYPKVNTSTHGEDVLESIKE